MPNVNPTLIRNYNVPTAAAMRLDDYYGPCWLVISSAISHIVIGNSAADCASRVGVTSGISSAAIRLDRLVGVWTQAFSADGLITVVGVGPESTRD